MARRPAGGGTDGQGGLQVSCGPDAGEPARRASCRASLMTMLRSLVFVALFYVWSLLCVIVMIPIALGPPRWMVASVRIWAKVFIAFMQPICGIRVEVRGREYIPTGAALVAAKHQCM